MNPSLLITAQGVGRMVPSAGGPLVILQDCSLQIPSTGMTAIVGPSGAGKTSLLYCLGGLDKPDAGSIWLGDTNIYALSEEKRSRFMRTTASFIFQEYNLIPYLTIEENIRLPLIFSKRQVARNAILETLERFGLTARRTSRASTLSGGEQQRAALCRSLLLNPPVVFADEPTGALDTSNTAIVLDVLRWLANNGRAVVMVTHDVESASLADRVVFMQDGTIRAITGPLSAGQILKHMSRLSGDRDV